MQFDFFNEKSFFEKQTKCKKFTRKIYFVGVFFLIYLFGFFNGEIIFLGDNSILVTTVTNVNTVATVTTVTGVTTVTTVTTVTIVTIVT